MGPKEAVSAAHDQLMKRYATSPYVVNRLFGRALELSQQGRSDLALDAYDELVRFFDRAIEKDIEDLVAASLFNRGTYSGI